MEFCKIYRCRWAFGDMRANQLILMLGDFYLVGDMYHAQIVSDGRVRPMWTRTLDMFEAYFERLT